MGRRLVVSFVFTLFAFQAVAQTAIPIDRFLPVTNEIYRGARPNDEGVTALAQNRFHTILNLENDSSAIAHEASLVSDLGMAQVSIPLSAFFTPADQDIDHALEVMNNAGPFPLFLHCLHGEDRTGLVVGLYRVIYQGWTPEDAYREMLDKGFHPILFSLKNYFIKRTGLKLKPSDVSDRSS